MGTFYINMQVYLSSVRISSKNGFSKCLFFPKNKKIEILNRIKLFYKAKKILRIFLSLIIYGQNWFSWSVDNKHCSSRGKRTTMKIIYFILPKTLWFPFKNCLKGRNLNFYNMRVMTMDFPSSSTVYIKLIGTSN